MLQTRVIKLINVSEFGFTETSRVWLVKDKIWNKKVHVVNGTAGENMLRMEPEVCALLIFYLIHELILIWLACVFLVLFLLILTSLHQAFLWRKESHITRDSENDLDIFLWSCTHFFFLPLVFSPLPYSQLESLWLHATSMVECFFPLTICTTCYLLLCLWS